MKDYRILKDLTKTQIKEFNNDIEQMIKKVIETGNIDVNSRHIVNSNIRLENKIFLNVSIEFFADTDGEIVGEVTGIKKYKNVDEYLDAINDVDKTKGDGLRLK